MREKERGSDISLAAWYQGRYEELFGEYRRTLKEVRIDPKHIHRAYHKRGRG